MDNPMDIIIDVILGLIIIFIFPLLYLGTKQDSLTQSIVEVETNSFVQEVRSKGYIDKNMYEEYLRNLSTTGILYDIEIEHKHNSLEPEYRFRTEDEVIDEQNNEYTGTNERNYYDVETEIPYVYDPIYDGNMNTETNESRIIGDWHIDAVASLTATKHVHTGSSSSGGGCYGGVTRHSHSGSSSSGGGCYSPRYHSHSDSCYGRRFCSGTITSSYVCSSCGKSFTSTSTVGARCGYSYPDYSNLTCTKSTSTVESYYLSCGKSSGQVTGYYINCGKTNSYYLIDGTEVSPTYNKTVASLIPTDLNQMIYINDTIITTADVRYNDGSGDRIICTTDFSTSNIGKNQTATLKYIYTIDGVIHTNTCTITVTIIPRNVTCKEGHIYNLDENGLDPGCPYCKAYLRDLTLQTPSSGKISIYRGTTLPDNGVVLLATYMDGHTELVYDEYIDNLDRYYVGLQNVKLSYKGKNTFLQVTTNRNISKCPVCNNWYELYPDNSDPGCPYCAALTPIFTGNILEYENRYYEKDILKEIYGGNEVYYFSDKDYLLMTIKNRTNSWGRGFIKNIFKSMGNEYIKVLDGGYIREEVQK